LIERRRFVRWVEQDSASWWHRGRPRHQACIMVTKCCLERVLNGPPAGKHDAQGKGFVDLVSVNGEEGGHDGSQLGGLIPRAYIMLHGIGWWSIAVKGIFAK
jgi:hypothetical protein